MFLVPVCIHITATVALDGSADFCCLSAGISPKIIVQFSANLVILPVIVLVCRWPLHGLVGKVLSSVKIHGI